MQPYVFPYLGYYQLLHAADDFVLFDDVNFIKKGWINRNRIRLNGAAFTFTIPIQGMSQNATIRDSIIGKDDGWKSKLLANLKQAYRKSPGFIVHYPAIEALITDAEGPISELAAASIRYVAQYAGLSTRIHFSSSIGLPTEVKGQERILAVAAHHEATRYINPINGAALYSEERFAQAGMELRFLRMDGSLHYPQPGPAPFLQGLSMIDVLMNTDREALLGLFGRYSLLAKAEVPMDALPDPADV